MIQHDSLNVMSKANGILSIKIIFIGNCKYRTQKQKDNV